MPRSGLVQQADAVNPHACGTFIMHPAHAGCGPKASRDRSPGTFGKNMLPAALIVITICLLVWLGFEIRWARRFVGEGIPVDATVSRREWISHGNSGRNLRITVAVQNENATKEYPIGYMSFFGFKNLQIGDRIPVLMHPSFSYVIPAGRMGVIARPFIAGSLFLASAICATAFTLSAITK
jgi:hypothetical protein